MKPRSIYKQIIADYRQLRRQGVDSWQVDCAKTRNLLHVIQLAALARDLSNDKHPHQHRLPNSLLRNFADRLLSNTDQIVKVKTFDDLYRIVKSNRLKGIGLLTIYDTSQRIGGRLKIYPDKIYLHRGTRVGVEIYLGRKIKQSTVDKSEFKDFKNLTCSEIEDVMCIYKDFMSLDNLKVGFSSNGC